MTKLLRWIGGIVGLYVVFVVIFESVYLGHLQPSFEEGGIPMLDIVTTDDAGQPNKRRLARLQSSSGPMYVSAHHWTRGWYHELVAHPEVRVERRQVCGLRRRRRDRGRVRSDRRRIPPPALHAVPDGFPTGA
jgi:hypothetical protein